MQEIVCMQSLLILVDEAMIYAVSWEHPFGEL